jgi:prepilin signal peptidase PulO-like enzyme (type II secretory pathway)
MLEIAFGLVLAALYWWEVEKLGLISAQWQRGMATPPGFAAYFRFTSHSLLLCWMLAASFIDIDEKIIPDEITVTGTVLGLLLATIAPLSLLPSVEERAARPVVGEAMRTADGQQMLGEGGPLWLEPVTAVSPQPWPPAWGAPRSGAALAIGLACFWLWCFALTPRIWRGRRGVTTAIAVIARRVCREFARPPLLWIVVVGSVAIAGVWALGDARWAGLLTALIGLVGGGGIVWAVRLIGTAALRREAMGFGDVTLMMMVGTFLGWQACLIAFFLAPPAGILIGIAHFISRRDDVIPYGPFLCLGSLAVIVWWGPIWMWGRPLFEMGGLVPAVVMVCLLLLGMMLMVWRIFKEFLFGRTEA